MPPRFALSCEKVVDCDGVSCSHDGVLIAGFVVFVADVEPFLILDEKTLPED